MKVSTDATDRDPISERIRSSLSRRFLNGRSNLLMFIENGGGSCNGDRGTGRGELLLEKSEKYGHTSHITY